jgi:hypothetical protein
MAKPIPTRFGDVLLLHTKQAFSVYVVGLVSIDGQQDFHGQNSRALRSRPAPLLWLPQKRLSCLDDGCSFGTSTPMPGRRFHTDRSEGRDFVGIASRAPLEDS